MSRTASCFYVLRCSPSQYCKHHREFSSTQIASSNSEEHWLNKYLPGVKNWVDKQVDWGWKKSIQDRCKQHPMLQGKEDDILDRVFLEANTLTEKYKHLETDSRSRTNIQIAAQTLATHKVLLAYIRNEEEVLQILEEQNGGKSEEGIRFDGLQSYNISYERPEWLGDGDKCCKIQVKQVTNNWHS